MKLVGIDIEKNKHFFCIMDKDSSELFVTPSSFLNTEEGFDFLLHHLETYPKDPLLMGMEDISHYHFALLMRLLNDGYSIALINSKTTNLQRRLQISVIENIRLDTFIIYHVLRLKTRKNIPHHDR